MEIFMFMEI